MAENDYSIRVAGPEDAECIALHRAQMFVDMGALSTGEADSLKTAATPWLHTLLLSGEYQGWIVELEGDAVGGGGIHLSASGPIPGSLQGGRRGHIANVYVHPDHRRRGLARRLLEEILRWSEHNGVTQLTLEASLDGRSLYASLGFIETPIMRRSVSPMKG